MKSPNTKYYYLFGFVGGDANNNNDDKIYFQKHKFDSISNFYSTSTLVSISNNISPITYYISRDYAYGKEVSCFQTDSELIICFYLTKELI